MKRFCECGRKVILSFSRKSGNKGRLQGSGVEDPSDHVLCRQCLRTLRAQVIAARMKPKPLWAYRNRNTLVLIQQSGKDSLGMVWVGMND
jgi:hypothetical protein